MVELGGTEFPYQADDGTCTVYSATEIAQIYVAAQTLITGQTAYHNALKSYVNAMTDAKEIAAVQYGMDLPEPYAAALSREDGSSPGSDESYHAKAGRCRMSSVELIAELTDICIRQAEIIKTQAFMLAQFGAEVKEEEALRGTKPAERNCRRMGSKISMERKRIGEVGAFCSALVLDWRCVFLR